MQTRAIGMSRNAIHTRSKSILLSESILNHIYTTVESIADNMKRNCVSDIVIYTKHVIGETHDA